MNWGYVIGIAASVCAILFGYLAFRRNDKNDERADARQQGAILAELGYIRSGVDDIKAEQREQRKFNSEVTTKIAALETATNRAHARIDRLERHEDIDNR